MTNITGDNYTPPGFEVVTHPTLQSKPQPQQTPQHGNRALSGTHGVYSPMPVLPYYQYYASYPLSPMPPPFPYFGSAMNESDVKNIFGTPSQQEVSMPALSWGRQPKSSSKRRRNKSKNLTQRLVEKLGTSSKNFETSNSNPSDSDYEFPINPIWEAHTRPDHHGRREMNEEKGITGVSSQQLDSGSSGESYEESKAENLWMGPIHNRQKNDNEEVSMDKHDLESYEDGSDGSSEEHGPGSNDNSEKRSGQETTSGGSRQTKSQKDSLMLKKPTRERSKGKWESDTGSEEVSKSKSDQSREKESSTKDADSSEDSDERKNSKEISGSSEDSEEAISHEAVTSLLTPHQNKSEDYVRTMRSSRKNPNNSNMYNGGTGSASLNNSKLKTNYTPHNFNTTRNQTSPTSPSNLQSTTDNNFTIPIEKLAKEMKPRSMKLPTLLMWIVNQMKKSIIGRTVLSTLPPLWELIAYVGGHFISSIQLAWDRLITEPAIPGFEETRILAILTNTF